MDPTRTLSSLVDTATKLPSWLVNGNTVSYSRPAAAPMAPMAQDDDLSSVPTPFRGAVMAASQHTNIPAAKLAAQFASENGGKWDPSLRGKTDPSDFGVTQLNPIAVQTITGGKGGQNYFKSNYGREFEPANATDQILGAGVYLNWLRQFGLPAAGIKNPTDEQVMTAYNTGPTGLAKAATSAPAAARAAGYQALLNRNGAL